MLLLELASAKSPSNPAALLILSLSPFQASSPKIGISSIFRYLVSYIYAQSYPYKRMCEHMNIVRLPLIQFQVQLMHNSREKLQATCPRYAKSFNSEQAQYGGNMYDRPIHICMLNNPWIYTRQPTATWLVAPLVPASSKTNRV